MALSTSRVLCAPRGFSTRSEVSGGRHCSKSKTPSRRASCLWCKKQETGEEQRWRPSSSYPLACRGRVLHLQPWLLFAFPGRHQPLTAMCRAGGPQESAVVHAEGSASKDRQAWEGLWGPDCIPALVCLTFLHRILPRYREAPLCSGGVNSGQGRET